MKLKLLLLSLLYTFTCLITTAQPPNDTFAGAIPIVIPTQGAASPQFTLPFSSDGTTDSGLDNAGCSNSGNDQFFTWTATSLSLTFNSLSPGNPGVAVYDGSMTLISCTDTFVSGQTVSGWALNDNVVIKIFDFQGSNADVAFDLFTIPCPAPDNLDVTPSITSADVTWTNNSTSTETILEYGISGFTAGSGTTINISGGLTTATIPSLMANTEYDYILTQDCSATGDGTSTEATGSFTTLCNPITPDYLADMSLNVPDCWAEANSGNAASGPSDLGAGLWSASNHNGTPSNRINLFSNTRSDWIISPVFDLSTAAPSELNIYVALTESSTSGTGADLGSDDRVSLLMTTDNGATWTEMQAWVQGTVPTDIGESITYDLSSITGSVQFAFLGDEGSVNDLEDVYFHVSTFQVRETPTCPDTINLTLLSFTDVDATINFDSGNVSSLGNYEYSLTTVSGATPAVSGSWTDVAGANPNVTYTISGLSPETEYFVHVREVCAVGNEGPWSITPVTFTTACSPIAAPYLEDFEMFTTSTSAFTSGNCWSGTGGSYFWETAPGTDTSSTGTGPAPSITTGNYFFTEATSGSMGDTTDLISPLVDLTALTAPALSFNYHMFGEDMGTLDVLVNGTTNVWTLSGEQQMSDTDPWRLAVVDLSAFAGQTISVTFRGTKGVDFESDMAIDNVDFGEAPSCFPPINIAVVATTFDGATIDFTNSNASTNSNFEYGAPGFTQGTGIILPQTTSTFTVTGLMSATTYDFYLQSDCGMGDVTTWEGPFSFTTDCNSFTDFNENFDGVSTPDLPVCWTSFVTTPAGTTAAVVQTNTAADNSPSNGVRLYSGSLTGNIGSGTTDEGETVLISPQLSNLAAGTHRIKFFADAGTATSTLEVGTMTDPTDPATFTLLGSFAPTTTHAEYIQNFDTYTGTDEYIAFRHIFAGTFDTMYLDDIVWEPIPSCVAPTDLALVSATDTQVTIGWTNNAGAAASSVIYGAPGFDPLVAGTTVAGTGDMATITGLAAETAYDFYVIQDCSATGDGQSSTSGPLSITTPCAAIPAPYFVDFENFSAATSGFVNDQCWNEISSTIYDWAIDASGGTTSSDTGPSGAFSGSTFMFVESSNGADGDIATVLSPAIDLTALTVPSLSFYYHMYGSQITSLEVGVSTDNGATFTNELTITGQQQMDSTDPWLQSIIDLSAYANQTVIVSFTTTKGTGTLAFEGDVSIDDVNFDELPVCNDVTAVTIDSVTSDSVTVSWTENSIPASTAWEVIAVPAGDPAPAVGTSNATTNPFTISSLMGITSYDVYVRADCSTAFVGPVAATTDCPVFVPDTFEAFTTFVPDCWDVADGGDLTTGPTNLGTSQWFAEEFAHVGSGNGAVNINLYRAVVSDWILSPIYDLSAGGYELNLDVALTDFNSTAAGVMGSDDLVALAYTTDGTTWTALQTWDLNNQPATAGETYNDALTGINSTTVQFGIYATDGAVDDVGIDYDFHIDNFQVRTPPTCPDTSNLTLVSNTDVTATINFDSGNATSNGDYEYSLTTVAGAAPAVTGAWSDVAGATPNVTYTIMGLTAETEYFVHVREVCAVGDESAWTFVPINFTTACAPVAAPYTEDFEMFTTATSAFASENCWSGTGGAYFWEAAPGTDTGSGGTGPNPSITTGNYFYTEASSGVTGDTTDLVSPLVDLTALTAPALSFNYHMFGAEIGTLDVLVNGSVNVWTLSGQQQAADTDPFELAVVDLAAYAGQTISITFRATSAGIFEGDIAIDNVSFDEAPACVNVNGVTVDSVTSDSATISWLENNIPPGTAWEVVTVPAGDPAPAVGTSNATTNPFTIPALMANTSYDVYVRADCSTSFAAPVNFTTLCNTFTAPYTEDFENAGATPDCWTLGGDEDWLFNLSGPNQVGNGGTLSGATASGGYYAVVDDSTPDASNAQMDSPFVDISTLASPELSFYLISDNTSDTRPVPVNATLTVSVWDGAAWNVAGTYNTDTVGWELRTIDLSAFTFTGPAQARFSVADSGSFYDDIAIDDVTFDEALTCINVSAITVDSTTADSITVSWTENNVPAATAWEVVAVPAGDPAPAVGTSNATTNPFTIPALMANTSYDIYVRTDCSTTFAAAITVTTDCTVNSVYPYVTDFTNNVPNACWDEAGSGEITDGPMTVGASEWRANRSYEDFAGNVTPSNAMNLYRNSDREWLLSEQYDMTGTSNDVLSIEVAVTDWTNTGASDATDTDTMGSDDQVDLLITTDGGTTWTSLMTWNAANQPAVDGTREDIDLSAYTGTVQFAFFATDGTVDDTEDYDFHVGMFIIDGTAGNNDVFENSLSLYPNPVNGDTVTISMSNTNNASVQIAIFNTLGQQVLTRSYPQATNEIRIDNLSRLSKGMYLIKVTDGKQESTLKFIKE
ncbi:putative secreted protein (Por secretion system target) [Nonlabens dokdonensis]|uniref:Secreted protein (Por secretion system target) n=2 Tax=Nonlabens dokdonensis TaxID=328515 RepID=A0ABX5Q2I4_9FLAO|nr:choice-of-anchor J domain-containing protein [Nonlabens dokdonensis]AGC76611.1 putative hemagluttinin family protein [Nonlabens dokdonensis DSW-6]PZX44260.1 putative secreted protein (Por secretion system target) [Nonlabens dokdonensis]